VAVLASHGEGFDALVEGKCCGEDKLFETSWDAIKPAQLASKYDGNCYLVCFGGASTCSDRVEASRQ
jgi:hypothetical protein